MSVDNTEIKKEDFPQAFADYFRLKVEKIQREIRVEPGVYNGAKKLFDVQNEDFMLESDIKECVESIKINLVLQINIERLSRSSLYV